MELQPAEVPEPEKDTFLVDAALGISAAEASDELNTDITDGMIEKRLAAIRKALQADAN